MNIGFEYLDRYLKSIHSSQKLSHQRHERGTFDGGEIEHHGIDFRFKRK